MGGSSEGKNLCGVMQFIKPTIMVTLNGCEGWCCINVVCSLLQFFFFFPHCAILFFFFCRFCFQIFIPSHSSWSSWWYPPCCLEAWNAWCVWTELFFSLYSTSKEHWSQINVLWCSMSSSLKRCGLQSRYFGKLPYLEWITELLYKASISEYIHTDSQVHGLQ